ncbi:hypothetical protein HAX54_038776 [Datura stramonium]|uniref:Uncharacterized protein n=1 Tax=Datura stramonium TaxID=4076 RepID=A0ABS8VLJ4_DATST|nr:hypothetical protein [Datura stramonium]
MFDASPSAEISNFQLPNDSIELDEPHHGVPFQSFGWNFLYGGFTNTFVGAWRRQGICRSRPNDSIELDLTSSRCSISIIWLEFSLWWLHQHICRSMEETRDSWCRSRRKEYRREGDGGFWLESFIGTDDEASMRGEEIKRKRLCEVVFA